MAHILVIDDDADVRFILESFLNRDGHTVDTAEDGKSGIKLTRLHDYDLIITDIIMPEMNGIEVLSEIKAKSPAIRIIVLTGGSAKLDKDLLLATAKAMRADKVISKPIDVKVLKAAVTELLAL